MIACYGKIKIPLTHVKSWIDKASNKEYLQFIQESLNVRGVKLAIVISCHIQVVVFQDTGNILTTIS